MVAEILLKAGSSLSTLGDTLSKGKKQYVFYVRIWWSRLSTAREQRVSESVGRARAFAK
jgi:hypothetical protein